MSFKGFSCFPHGLSANESCFTYRAIFFPNPKNTIFTKRIFLDSSSPRLPHNPFSPTENLNAIAFLKRVLPSSFCIGARIKFISASVNRYREIMFLSYIAPSRLHYFYQENFKLFSRVFCAAIDLSSQFRHLISIYLLEHALLHLPMMYSIFTEYYLQVPIFCILFDKIILYLVKIVVVCLKTSFVELHRLHILHFPLY